MNRYLTILLLAVLAFSYGCATPRAVAPERHKAVGPYSLENSRWQGGTLTLDVDGTFTTTFKAPSNEGSGVYTYYGSWELLGNRLTLTPNEPTMIRRLGHHIYFYYESGLNIVLVPAQYDSQAQTRGVYTVEHYVKRGGI